jgi:hypothetical protein
MRIPAIGPVRALAVSSIVWILLIWTQAAVLAQEPSLAPSDMEFTRKIIKKYHFMTRVALEMEDNKFTQYQYDHYPASAPGGEVERIKADEGVFARQKGKRWLKSDDWGETGTPVADELVQKLNMDVEVVSTAFAMPHDLDATQGGTVWKFIERAEDKNFTYYTYERSRERPHPDGVYPRLTFMKAAHDVDGRLFLCKMTAQLRSGGAKRIPVNMHFIYLISVPAKTQVQVFDQVTGKQKYKTVTGKNSGWEITARQSAPPQNP